MVRTRLTRGPNEDWTSFYRRYQRTLANEYLIPLLMRWGVNLRGARILEVGCGDGGCGAALAEVGSHVTMIDIDSSLVEVARRRNEAEGIDARVELGDITDPAASFLREGAYDLVVFRDVIEHIADAVCALRNASGVLSGDGRVFVIFPPYYSPFGAHQQILPRRVIAGIPYTRLPYLQLLPDAAFRRLVRGEGFAYDEVRHLRQIRLTIGALHSHVRDAGLRIVEAEAFLSRPSFALRWGLPVVRAPRICRMPLLREVTITAACYLLASGRAP